MSLWFAWDHRKAVANLAKHGVAFAEAVSAFSDPVSLTIPDPGHSIGEERWMLLGMSSRSRRLVIAHVDHGDHIRIISARPATRRERHAYEEATD